VKNPPPEFCCCSTTPLNETVLPDTGSATDPLNKPVELVMVIFNVVFVLVILFAVLRSNPSMKLFDRFPFETARIPDAKFNTGVPLVKTYEEPAASDVFVNPPVYNLPPEPDGLNHSTVPSI